MIAHDEVGNKVAFRRVGRAGEQATRERRRVRGGCCASSKGGSRLRRILDFALKHGCIGRRVRSVTEHFLELVMRLAYVVPKCGGAEH